MSAINTLGNGLYGVGWLAVIGGGAAYTGGYFEDIHEVATLGMGAAGVGFAMVVLGKLPK